MIRIPQVRVVDEEGAQLGVMPTPRALEMAQDRGLDLVEVAPMASPPVVRFLDLGQYKYELTKREKEAKRKQRSVTFKEVRLSPKIGIGDFDTKVNRAIEFLEDGDRIKVTVRFRGRELTHPELGRNLLARFTDRLKDHGLAERTPLLEGKSMHITMASTHKPKGHDGPAIKGGDAAEPRSPASPAPTGAPVQLTTPVTPTAPVPPAPAAAADPPAASAPVLLAPAEVEAPPAVTKPKAARAPARSATQAEATSSESPGPTKAAAESRTTRTTKARTPAPEPVATGE